MLVTGLYAALAVFFLVLLIFRIVLLRFKLKVSLGDGGFPELKAAIRVHGNYIEMVPIALIMIQIFETVVIPPLWMVHVLCITLLVARLFHAIDLTIHPTKPSLLRPIGMMGTLLAMILPAIATTLHYFGLIIL